MSKRPDLLESGLSSRVVYLRPYNRGPQPPAVDRYRAAQQEVSSGRAAASAPPQIIMHQVLMGALLSSATEVGDRCLRGAGWCCRGKSQLDAALGAAMTARAERIPAGRLHTHNTLLLRPEQRKYCARGQRRAGGKDLGVRHWPAARRCPHHKRSAWLGYGAARRVCVPRPCPHNACHHTDPGLGCF